MNRWFVSMVLTGLVLALAACGSSAPATEPQVVVESADDIQRITAADAKALQDSGDALIYDARSEAAYQQAHAAGAISFPAGEAAARSAELPADKSLVFY